MVKKFLLVFDIETIPDEDSALALLDSTLQTTEDKRQALINYHLEITDNKNDFLRQPFHKIVAISYVSAAIEYHQNKEIFTFRGVRSLGSCDSGEKSLIEDFFKIIEQRQPRIVTFNGRTFDIPVLKYRAMKYGINCSAFYTKHNNFENYNYRYAQDWHSDLFDLLSDYGASARVKLNEVCSILQLPGKIGIDGSQVTHMYDNGNIADIRNYCETDVLNTYLLYLRYALHIGKISKESYNKAIQEVKDSIEQSLEAHLRDFYISWQQVNNNSFYLN